MERLVKLIASVAVSFDEAFRDFTIQYVIRKTDARDWAPRFRACQILSQTLKALPEDAELGDDIWDEIYRRMRERLDDRAPAVRSEAVTAIQRLQDPNDVEDAVIARFCEMMREDPSGDVRKVVICHVAICKSSLKELVERTRDVHPPARRAAFRVLGSYVNIKNLKISQRTQLLSDGLRDRDDKVRNECSKMCLSWLSNVEMDILALLRLVDVEVCEEGAELLLLSLFRDAQGVAPVHIDPEEKLSSEAALYMRVLAQYWKNGDAAAQENFDNQVPELTSICTMMELNAGQDFVLKQLLGLAMLRDFSDEAGRVAMSALLRGMLPSPQVSQHLVDHIIRILAQCHSDEVEFIQVVLEMVADVREPLDLMMTEEAKAGFAKALQRRDDMKLKFAKLKKIIKISQAPGQEDQLRKAKAKAVEVRDELEQMESQITMRAQLEEHIWFRMLCVTELLLEHTQRGSRHPGILGLLDGVLQPALLQNSVVVKEKALCCLALYCLLDQTTGTVARHGPIFLEHCRSPELELRTTAVKCLFDIGMLYGFGCLPEVEVLATLSKYASDEAESSEIRGLVVEGFSKLYLMDQCKDAELLGTLLLLFFSPATASELRLRQCLSVFFPTYAFSSQEHQALCSLALVPAMRRILLADPSSMLRKIDWSLFCKFGAHLVSPANAQYDMQMAASEPSWHEETMLRIAFEMRAEEKGQNQFWARALASFVCRPPMVEGDEASSTARLRFVAKLTTAVAAAAEETSDKRARQWTEKRLASIREALTTDTQGMVTKTLMSEVADEMEIEVEQYLDLRRVAVASFRHGAGATAAIYEDSGADDADSPSPVAAKKNTKKKAATRATKAKAKTSDTTTPPKKATTTAAKMNWGIKVVGESVKKRQRRKLLEVVDTSDASKVLLVQDDESPPKKGKSQEIVMESLEAEHEEVERGDDEEDEEEDELEIPQVDEDDAGRNNKRREDEEENMSPARRNPSSRKKAKTPPEDNKPKANTMSMVMVGKGTKK